MDGTPTFDEALPCEMVQSKDKPKYFIQGTNVFDHRKRFWYSLTTELKPPDIDTNAGYKVEILPEPVPYDVPESEKYQCTHCDYTSGSKYIVENHRRKVHHYHKRPNGSRSKGFLEIKKVGEK